MRIRCCRCRRSRRSRMCWPQSSSRRRRRCRGGRVRASSCRVRRWRWRPAAACCCRRPSSRSRSTRVGSGSRCVDRQAFLRHAVVAAAGGMESKMVSAEEKDHVARRAKAQAVALFRYTLIRDAADASIGPRQRGKMVAEIVARTHRGPFAEPVQVSRASVDRWIRAWRSGGFEALIPPARQVQPRTETAVLEMAIALKRENPQRTAAQVVRILRQTTGSAPSERTLQRHFLRRELADGSIGGGTPATFGRFEADRPNELWVGDALHGPHVAGRKTYLFAFLDDHSRAFVGHRFGY